MTQAFNLSQLANKVNTSGQLNASTGLSSTVPVANGGTNLSSPGAAGNILTSNGTAWVSQAASAGFSGATVNSPSGTALTLTNTSAQCQILQFTSPVNSVVTLPSATTLLYKGAPIYRLINESQCNSVVQVKNAVGTWIATIQVNEAVDITLEDNSTSAGSWMVDEVNQLPNPAAVENASISSALAWTGSVFGPQTYYMGEVKVVALTDSTFVFAWQYAQPSTLYQAVGVVAATLSGNTFTFGAVQTNAAIGTVAVNEFSRTTLFRLNNTTAIFDIGCWADQGCGFHAWYRRCAAVTVSGNTCTLGAWNAAGMPESGVVGQTNNLRPIYFATQGFRFRISDTTFASVYQTDANYSAFANAGQGNLSCTITSVSGTTQTNGTAVVLAANNGTVMGATSHVDNAFIISYYTLSSAGASGGIRKAVTCNVSGTVPTWGTVTNIDLSNVTVVASPSLMQGGVTFSSTKVALPTFQRTGSGDLYTIGTFTISGATNAYVASSDYNTGSASYYAVPRTASSCLLFPSCSTKGRISEVNAFANQAFKMLSVNANNAIYPDTEYTFQNNLQNGLPFFSNNVAVSSSSSTQALLISSTYSVGTPIGATIYLSKGTIPS